MYGHQTRVFPELLLVKGNLPFEYQFRDSKCVKKAPESALSESLVASTKKTTKKSFRKLRNKLLNQNLLKNSSQASSMSMWKSGWMDNLSLVCSMCSSWISVVGRKSSASGWRKSSGFSPDFKTASKAATTRLGEKQQQPTCFGRRENTLGFQQKKNNLADLAKKVSETPGLFFFYNEGS